MAGSGPGEAKSCRLISQKCIGNYRPTNAISALVRERPVVADPAFTSIHVSRQIGNLLTKLCYLIAT